MVIPPSSRYRSYRDVLDDLPGRRVLCRVDINLPVGRDGRIESFYKARRHLETTVEVLGDSALVLISHQGRVGDDNFISMEQHAEWFSERLGDRFRYVADIIGEKALETIRGLRPGEVLLLDNVRLLAEETLKADVDKLGSTIFVSRLAPLFDYFINDAFGALHRAHTSMVGFVPRLPSYIGPLVEEELGVLETILSGEESCAFILGGAKPETKIRVMRNILASNPNSVFLLGGAIANLFLTVYGSIPKSVANEMMRGVSRGIIRECMEIVEAYGDRIYLPRDFRMVVDGEVVEKPVSRMSPGDRPEDIGSETVERYIDVLRGFDKVMVNGPLGIIENPLTRWGTEQILLFLAGESGMYRVAGGGHIVLALERLGVINSFNYVSTGGGSLLTLLSGEEPPALKLLSR